MMSVYGGNQGVNTAIGSNVLMTGGTVDQIFGAGAGYSFGTTDKPVNVTVQVLGGTITRRVYGGCYNNFTSKLGLGILGGKYGTWDTTYQVNGNITLIIGDQANISFSLTSENDRAVYATSRLSTHNSTGALPANENSKIIFLNTYQSNKLGAQDSIMQAIMSTVKTTADEIHTVTYSASGAVITQTCNGSGHDKDESSATVANTAHSATATLSVSGTPVYTGSAIQNAQVAYSAEWLGEQNCTITYSNNINAGTATATATCNGVTATLNFTIEKATQAAPSVTAVAESIKGKADGKINGLTTAMEISTNGTTYTAVSDVNATYAAGTYYVRLAETANYAASPATTVTVAAGRQLSITFKADGNTVATKYVDYNGTLTDIPTVPTKTGYTQTPPTWSVTSFSGITTDVTVNAVYTINVYTVTFVADNATVATKQVNHGATLSDVPAVPAKTGYNGVWNTTNFSTVTGDMTVTAVYTLKTYTVIFIIDGTTVKTETVTHGSAVTAPAIPAKEGFDRVAPTWDVTDLSNTTSDLTVTAVYTANLYTVTFMVDGQVFDTQTIAHGTALTDLPAVPAKAGYDGRWQSGDLSTVTSDLTVTAVYTIKSYTVIFVVDGQQVRTVAVNHGNGVVNIPEIPAKEGYTQTAPYWDTDLTAVTSDLTVTAVYTPNVYTVTFVVDGQTYHTVTVTHGSAVTAPAIPTKEGYDKTAPKWDKTDLSSVTGDMTVTAKYTVNKYSIVFIIDGKSTIKNNVTHGTKLSQISGIPAIPAKAGYDKVAPHWDHPNDTVITSALTITAVYTPNVYTVTFMDGTTVVATKEVTHGNALSDVPAVPTKTGYTSAWEVADFSTVTKDMTVNAVHTVITYTVTFKDGSTVVSTVTVNHGESVTAPAVPTKVGYTSAWETVDLTAVTSDLTVNALHTINVYTVIFTADGEVLATLTVNHGEGATAPEIPAKVGYTAAWDTANFDTVTGDMTISAVYTVKTYTVTFVANGTVINTVTVNHGEALTGTHVPPEKADHTAAWDKEIPATITADLTLTAVYTPIETEPDAPAEEENNGDNADSGNSNQSNNAPTNNDAPTEESGSGVVVVVVIVAVVLVCGAVVVVIVLKKKKK